MRALVWSLWEQTLTTSASCLQNPSRRSALEDSSWNDAVNSRGHQPGHLRGIVLKLSAHWLPTLHTTQHPCLVTSKMAQQTVPAHENEDTFISQQTLHWVVVWYACSSIIGGCIYLTWAYSFCEKKNHLSFAVSVQSKGVMQTLTPFPDCSNDHHWGPHCSFLKSLLPWLQCTILVLIFPLDNYYILLYYRDSQSVAREDLKLQTKLDVPFFSWKWTQLSSASQKVHDSMD